MKLNEQLYNKIYEDFEVLMAEHCGGKSQEKEAFFNCYNNLSQ